MISIFHSIQISNPSFWIQKYYFEQKSHYFHQLFTKLESVYSVNLVQISSSISSPPIAGGYKFHVDHQENSASSYSHPPQTAIIVTGPSMSRPNWPGQGTRDCRTYTQLYSDTPTVNMWLSFDLIILSNTVTINSRC